MPSEKRAAFVVLTADQVGSRTSEDAVPTALTALAVASPGAMRGFARTAGDEIQALFDDVPAALAAIECLYELGAWRVGVGVGSVRTPLPDDVRAATGDAFVAAREAVEAARLEPTGVAVRDGGTTEPSRRAEAALQLLALTWRRRTAAGWQVARLLEGGSSQRDIAGELAITPSAVSQRARAAAVEEVAAGKALAVWLLDRTREASLSGHVGADL